MDRIQDYFKKQFRKAFEKRSYDGIRIGSELKFPLVEQDGSSVPPETVEALWQFLAEAGWSPLKDEMTGRLIGATLPGPYNHSVAGTETGYSKTEFSLAHVGDLFELESQLERLKTTLAPFCRKHSVLFLGHGIHPVSPPSERLMIKKQRTSPWGRAFGSNRHIKPEDGDDVHLFTVNAASHVHVGVPMEQVIDAVNVLNGFSGGQLALTAHSRVWKSQVDPTYRCVSEKLWDWWIPDEGRVGVPLKRFEDLSDYVSTISSFRPVYVVRNGQPLVLKRYATFGEYLHQGRAVGEDAKGQEVSFMPDDTDIDLHNSCYWFNARISRYFTVENRTNDQQSPESLLTIPAMTLGLVSAIEEAKEVLAPYEWDSLRALRESACRDALEGTVDGLTNRSLAVEMLKVARLGLERRGNGEAVFLEPLEQRLTHGQCPADVAADRFQQGGIQGLLEYARL